MLMRACAAGARIANTTRAKKPVDAIFAALMVQSDHKLLADFVSDADRKVVMISPKWLLDHQRMSVGLAAIWGDRAYRTSANALVY